MSVAAFMELALYHPEHGYYASRAQRSGRGGDFYTSVDVGPIFGELLAAQIIEMARLLDDGLDLVEAAAGNGRLTRDILDALEREAADVYGRSRVCLVERSPMARAQHTATLGPHASRLHTSHAALPDAFSGILFANELLDALPAHVAVMRNGEPREIVVDADGDRLVQREQRIADPALLAAVTAGTHAPDGVRFEVGLDAMNWMREAARRLSRGFIMLIDYGDDDRALRSLARPEGTLRAFSRHRVSGHWLEAPGTQDLTVHVDFTAIARVASETGLELLGRVDQSRFLLGLGALERLQQQTVHLPAAEAARRRLAAKSLLVPGGIGSTHTVMIFGKNVGRPSLAGLSLAR